MNESKLLTRARIERRAYDCYLERGAGNGRDLDDWFAAEKELTDMSEQPASSAPKAFVASAGTSTREAPGGNKVRTPESRIPKRSSFSD